MFKKNILESILGTLLGIERKMKDTLQSRLDLKEQISILSNMVVRRIHLLHVSH